MKTKQTIYVSTPHYDDFLRGNFNWCFTCAKTGQTTPDYYIKIAEIEFDIDVDHDTVNEKVVDKIDAEIDEEQALHHLKLEALKSRRSELLALTHEKAA